MSGVKFQIGDADASGVRRFKRTAKAAGDDLSDLKQANAEAARVVEPVARQKAPKGATGRLARSVRSSGTRDSGVIRAGSRSVPYAGVIHFGTERAKSPFWQKRRIVGRPFASDAAHETESDWGPIYQAALQRAISRIQGA